MSVILYSHRDSSLAAYDTAIISILESIAPVTVVGNSFSRAQGENHNLVVIGAPGTSFTEHPSYQILGDLRANLLVLCRKTMLDGIGGYGTGSTSMSGFTRDVPVEQDPRNIFSSVDLLASGGTVTGHYWGSTLPPRFIRAYSYDSTSTPGIAHGVYDSEFSRTFFGFHRFDIASNTIIELFKNYVDAYQPVPISGRAIKADGSPADHVYAFQWMDGRKIVESTPDTNGDWAMEVPPGQFGLTYLATGCKPITHGPYLAEPPEEQ